MLVSSGRELQMPQMVAKKVFFYCTGKFTFEIECFSKWGSIRCSSLDDKPNLQAVPRRH